LTRDGDLGEWSGWTATAGDLPRTRWRQHALHHLPMPSRTRSRTGRGIMRALTEAADAGAATGRFQVIARARYRVWHRGRFGVGTRSGPWWCLVVRLKTRSVIGPGSVSPRRCPTLLGVVSRREAGYVDAGRSSQAQAARCPVAGRPVGLPRSARSGDLADGFFFAVPSMRLVDDSARAPGFECGMAAGSTDRVRHSAVFGVRGYAGQVQCGQRL